MSHAFDSSAEWRDVSSVLYQSFLEDMQPTRASLQAWLDEMPITAWLSIYESVYQRSAVIWIWTEALTEDQVYELSQVQQMVPVSLPVELRAAGSRDGQGPVLQHCVSHEDCRDAARDSVDGMLIAMACFAAREL